MSNMPSRQRARKPRGRAAILADRMLAVTLKHVINHWNENIPSLRKKLAAMVRKELRA